MSSPAERELLSQDAARQLLQRAGEIDSSTLRVDDLRSAAREAGISEAAFEAALAEMRGQVSAVHSAEPARPARRWPLIAALSTLVAGAIVVFFSMAVIPSRVPEVRMETTARLSECLSAENAASLIAPTGVTAFRGPGNTLRLRGNPEQVNEARALLDRASATCEVKAAAKKTR